MGAGGIGMTESSVQIVLGLFTLSGVLVTAWVSWVTKRHAGQVNDAVNNTHPGNPKLYDLAVHNAARVQELERAIAEHVEAEEAGQYPAVLSELESLRQLIIDQQKGPNE